jgi:hypothetical protein
MDDYARASARVYAALLALQRAPEAIRARYADEFTQELVSPSVPASQQQQQPY